MSDFLADVAERTRQRIQTEKNDRTMGQIRDRLRSSAPVKPFAAALKKPKGLGLIAELKQASPSAGVIRKETDLVKRLEGYAEGGASALSILTEPHYFHGSTQILELARKECALPILRKDFMIDPFQIEESRAIGADAILLIVAMLELSKLKDFLSQARALGLEALIEVHDERELDTALQAGGTLLGVNNRNLKTLKVDLTTALRVIPHIPKGSAYTAVVESGVQQPSQMKEFKAWGAHAVLIGEALMRHENAREAVQTFVEASEHG